MYDRCGRGIDAAASTPNHKDRMKTVRVDPRCVLTRDVFHQMLSNIIVHEAKDIVLKLNRELDDAEYDQLKGMVLHGLVQNMVPAGNA